MANIFERPGKDGKPRYTARVRVKGHPAQVATFRTKTEAKTWADKTRADLQQGLHLPAQAAKAHTLAEAIDRYIAVVLPNKSASTQYGQGIQLAHWRAQLGHMRLSQITPEVLADERDRLAEGTTQRKAGGKLDRATRSRKKGKDLPEGIDAKRRTPATVVRYMAALSHCLTYTQKELRWIADNPMRNVSKPKEPRGRVRILSDTERAALLAACKESKCEPLHDIVVMLLSTAARRNEIGHLQWKHVDLERRVIVLDETKNGDRRVIPIRGEAERILIARSKIRRIDNPHVFPAPFRRGVEPKPVDIQSAWDWAVERAGIEDFRMHDLRHSAASYLAMNGASLAELAEVLGHKTLQMVRRYTHLSETHTGDLLERMNTKIFGGAADEKAHG